MKLSKRQIATQDKCEEFLKKDKLTLDEKEFVYENWHEGATNINSTAGAFFTPYGLARDFQLEICNGQKTVDLCAGIGMLSFVAYHYQDCKDITCIELNEDYVRVGKKLLPEAKWVNGSVFDIGNDHYEQAISNPPFGKIKTGLSDRGLKYTGAEFDLKVIDLASQVADRATFILPQASTPFIYSGSKNGFSDLRGTDRLPSKVAKFIKQTGIEYEFNMGLCTEAHIKDWKGVTPMCEIVNFHFEHENEVVEETEEIESNEQESAQLSFL